MSEVISLVRLPAVKLRCGIGRTTIYKLISEKAFPAPRKILGGSISVWPSNLLDDWISAQLQGGV